ncbi:hypothetical protein L484_022418 [Morus notabilis]|uniref:NAD-dependent epimerase/dehydratase domain-containing protein n=1 Tax=Morus notabilis TaxID=981085 RepID=W9R2G0_9ROSA|nr:hypothetical protein L484_022418 [Morus notabilis]
MEGGKGTVCVTGGTGYIGSWLIMRLLDHGYHVKTTVRSNPGHKKDLSFLTSLSGASEKLKIIEADLDDPESFVIAVEGCVGVFHVATPIDFENKEEEEIVTKRSIDGAIGILKACVDSNTVKKVVYTSSSSAVILNGKDFDEMDETFWSDIDYVKSLKSNAASYMVSKTLTEKAVLEFSEKHDLLEVVTLIPPFVVGPFICPKPPGSVFSVFNIIFGEKNQSSSMSCLDLVHVDDVARAHIFIFEHPEAKGSSLFNMEGPKQPCLSSKKLLALGFEFKYGVEEMFDDAIKCCIEKGYL